MTNLSILFHSFIHSFIYIHLSFSFVTEVCVSSIFTVRVCAAIMTCLLFSLVLFICSLFVVCFVLFVCLLFFFLKFGGEV